MERARKKDWKTLEMPLKNESFELDFELTKEEFSALQKGHIPQEMEDKWFMYYDDGKFYFHRSWTGFCIYILSVSDDGKITSVIVNRDSKQYRETDIKRDKKLIMTLLTSFVGWQGTRDLMKEYIIQQKNQ